MILHPRAALHAASVLHVNAAEICLKSTLQLGNENL